MNLIVYRAFYGPLLLAAPAPAAPPPGVPLAKVSAYAHDVARRAHDRAGYDVTGFVLTDRTRGAKCIVDGQSAAWMPGEQAKELLKWKRPKQDAAPVWVDCAPPEDVDDGERALQRMANRLGIPFNSLIAHNTGFFVPGITEAFPSAGAAIEALFELVYTSPDATVYRPGKADRGAGEHRIEMTREPMSAEQIDAAIAALAPKRAPAPPKKPAPAPEPVEAPQMGLF
jgi:hypothetical protein